MSDWTDARARALLRSLFDEAVRVARPEAMLAAHLPPPPEGGRTLVLGAGKAGGAMVAALEAAWPAEAPLSGLVVTRYGHTPPGWAEHPHRVELVEAAHPVPDAAGQRAAERMLALTRGLTERDLVICLVSGGGSALLSLPMPGLTLADKQAVNRALLASGAPIGAMNTVRKHLSAIKGGRLAAACAPARVLSLLISDVPGDEPSVIASGPTVPDPGTCAEALALLDRHGIALPALAREALRSGAWETPKPGDACFARAEARVIAAPRQSLEAAAALARQQGLAVHVLSDEIEGESSEVGRVHAALARACRRHGQPFARPCLILSGGETTVTLPPPGSGQAPGRGGRATEFLLGTALALQGEPGIWALAGDTDGIDGVEDNAGAWVTPDTLARAAVAGVSAAEHLQRHDAYGFFGALGDLLVTGPTMTNVNDFRALLVV